MNVYQKLIEVKKEARAFSKDTKGYGYDYVSGSQILNKITSKMNGIGLLFIPVFVGHDDWEKHEYVSKGKEKTDFIIHGDIIYKWVNAEKPEDFIEIKGHYYGQQDDISKSQGSAWTYFERYALLKSLGLPTDSDDPDSKNTKDNTNKVYKQTKKEDGKISDNQYKTIKGLLIKDIKEKHADLTQEEKNDKYTNYIDAIKKEHKVKELKELTSKQASALITRMTEKSKK